MAATVNVRRSESPVEELLGLSRVSLMSGFDRILDRVSLSVRSGETIALFGQSGSGKTQLLRIVATLVIPVFGSVQLFGQKVRRNQQLLNSLRRRLGMQFQNFALFDSMNVLENVSFPLTAGLGLPEGRGRDLARAMLERVGLAGAEALEISALSGGMKRRLSVARVLAAEPELAIFDDPIAGLDPRSAASLMELVFSERSRTGGTTIVAGNDLERIIPGVDRVLMLEKGAVVFDGAAADFRASAGGAAGAFAAAGLGRAG